MCPCHSRPPVDESKAAVEIQQYEFRTQGKAGFSKGRSCYDRVEMSTKALMTVEQFAQIHTADTEDYGLVEGELIPLATGTYRHNKTRDLLGHLLWAYFKGNAIGEAVADYDCHVGDVVRRPDLSIFLAERLHRLELDKVSSPVPPDIAVEVLSRSDSDMDVRRETLEYLRGGAQEVWHLDYLNVEVQIRAGDGIRILQETDLLESRLLPGFTAAVGDLLKP